MNEEIIIIIDPDPPRPGGRELSGWSVRFVCNGDASIDALRTAKRAIERKLEELGAGED